MTAAHFFSVVTPVLDGGAVFDRCLAALRRSSFQDFELIVVDDGSTDGSGDLARSYGASVLETLGRVGPGAARNLGARIACGEFLLFIDADCEVHLDTLERAAAILRSDSGPDALFGCYDEEPAARGTVSEYKNLMHRYVHLEGRGRASTFWAGCGAVRRDLFLAVEGFDETRFARPSIEDIELGYRLSDRGARIELADSVEVRHHKRWTLPGLLRTDVLDRGVPWTQLILERRGRATELNLGWRTRASVVLVWLAGAAALATLIDRRALVLATALLLVTVGLNWRTFRYLARLRGAAFALRCVPLHLLYFGYSGVAYLLGVLSFGRRRLGGRPSVASARDPEPPGSIRRMSSLHFCMLTTFYPPYNFGGDGIGTQRFSQALVRRGHRVTVVHDRDAYRLLAGGEPDTDGDLEDGVEVVGLESRLGPLSVLLTQQSGRPLAHGRRLRQLLAARDFDVLNFHNISLLGGPGLLAAGDVLKLYMAHEHWLVCPSHVLWRHDREPCDGRECLRCVLSYRRPPQLWRRTGLLERHLDHVDAFIAMSDFSRRKHREFGFDREMEVVNYFLPDPQVEPPADGEVIHDRPFFLFVGRLETIKGLDTVLPIFHAYEDADLLIAGSGEDEVRLRHIAGDSPRIKFLGRVSQETLSRYYRQAVALIVPSVGFETFGIILIEAFRQGTPVLARRIGPFPEIVERCGGGMLFDGAAELESAMRSLQENPGHRDEMALAAHRGFERHWSEEAVMPRYLEVVRDAARRTGRTHIVDALA